MFRIPRVNVIESDEGFSVEVLGRVGLRYKEGLKSMFIDSEVQTGSSIALFKASIRAWDAPYDGEIIDDNKRETIINNIREAFRFDRAGIDVY